MIRPAGAEDFEFIYNLYMHPLVNPFLFYEEMDRERFQPIYDGLLRQQAKYIYGTDVISIGMFKLIPLEHRNQHIVYLGGLAIHPSYSGSGEGLKMMKAIIAFANQSGFLRIELTVADTNKKAIRLYEKVGFQKEGVLRKFTWLKSREKFINEIMMALVF